MDLGGFGGFDDIFGSFGDIFEDFFGFGPRRSRPAPSQPGADLRQRLILTLEEVVNGLDSEIQVHRHTACSSCQGSGMAPGTQRQTCSQCHGRGQISQSRGFLRLSTTCPVCRGAGSFIATPCRECQGSGALKESRKVQVRIPPGVDNGTRLRLRGEGEAGRFGGPPGDLYIEVQVAPHPLFTRQGQDLHYQTELSFVSAALGTKLDIPTLNGVAPLTIPAGTQSGATFRIPGQGVPHIRGNHLGDLVVEVSLKTPTQLTARQEKLLREFLKLENLSQVESQEKRN
jgi:molecular chaperone DnaJ